MPHEIRRSGPCWIAYVDIYAFSYHVAKLGEGEVYERLYEAMKNIRAICESHGIESVHLSDSLFVIAFDGVHGTETLNILVNCLAHSQDELLNCKFIPRGSLAHGNIELSPKVIVGSPLVRAVRLEQELATPCVFLPLREMSRAKAVAPSSFVHDISVKGGGLIRGVPILPQTLGPLNTARSAQLDEAVTNGPAHAAQALTDLGDLIDAYANHQRRARPAVKRPAQKPGATFTPKPRST